MKPIPIYDATVPIACTATEAEIPERVELVERLRTHLDRVERTEHGLLLHFPNRPEIADDLARFAVDEKGCCRFWGFATETTDDAITFRWDGPPSVAAVLDELRDFFEGDEPLTALAGLL